MGILITTGIEGQDVKERKQNQGNMVHPGGFEPPTARFVAEYSIQLSYGCIGKAIWEIMRLT